jgi:hypothetical protein
MSRIPDRKDIVTDALKEINPAAEAACEKEIRIYLSLLDDLRALSEESLSWPSPAEMKADMKRLAKALKKVETILLLPTYPAPVPAHASIFGLRQVHGRRGEGVQVGGLSRQTFRDTGRLQ